MRRDESADDIDFQHVPEGVFGQVQQRRVVVDAGGAHHHIHTGSRDQRLHNGRTVANVGHCRANIQALRAQQVHGGQQGRARQVHGHHLKTIACQACRRGQTYTLGRRR
jgi:hypothetical protein